MRFLFILFTCLSFMADAQPSTTLRIADEVFMQLSANRELKADSAIRLLKKLYQDLGSLSSDSMIYYKVKVLTELSYYEHALSNYDKSISNGMEALRLAEQLGNQELIYNAAHRLGSTYAKLGSSISTLNGVAEMEQYRQKARAYFGKTTDAALQLKDSAKVINSQVGVINTYLSGKQNDSVLALSTGLLRTIKPEMHKEKSQLFNLAGIATYEAGQFSVAGNYFRNAINEARLVPGSLTLNSSLGNLANVYMEQGNYAPARALLYELIESNKAKKRKQALSKNFITLHNIYKRQRIYDSALFYFEKYYLYRDSVLGDDHKLQIEELGLKYESEKKENRINELTLSNALKTAQIRQKNLWMTLLLIVVFTIPVVVYLYYRQRTLRQRQINAETRQQLLTAQMNPHFLFNALNSIQRLYVDGRIEEGNLFMSEFAQFVRDILDKTGRMKIPVEEEAEFLNAYLSLEKKRLGDSFDFSILLDESLQQTLVEVPSLISQPLAENALLHGIRPKATAGFIEVIIRPGSGNTVEFLVRDNGIGYEEGLKTRRFSGHDSKGTELTRARLGNKGKLTIETIRDAKGTILGTEASILVTV